MHTAIDISFQKMNDYGANKTPFVALVNFNVSKIQLFTIAELAKENIFIQFPNFSTSHKAYSYKPLHLKISPIPFAHYDAGFQTVMQGIKHGNSFLCNYTCSTPIECNGDLKEIFGQTVAKYKVFFKDEWVCFSPEIFIKTDNNLIYTYPMKGTIDAQIADAEKIILTDSKETAEHYTIVDLMRNDLNTIATNVQVQKFRYIDTINSADKKLLQVSSCISGELPQNWQSKIGSILASLLPAGSISGAPKKKTMEIINSAETHDRGFYTGVAVYFDGENLDSCVLIRFIEKTNEGLVYKSGGGITHNSKVDLEYAEIINKIYLPLG